MCRAQEAEDNFVIKRELAAAKQLEQELRADLEKANSSIVELKEKRDLSQSLESQEHRQLIESLQEELIAVKLRDAENNEEMKGLRERIRQLEDEINHLRQLPADHATAKLQDELLAVKLREAEANLSIKELKEKISELRTMWNEHMSIMHPDSTESSQPNSLENGGSNNSSLNSNSLNGTSTPIPSLSVTSSPLKILNAVKRSSDQAAEINKLKTELMSAKLREAEAFSDLKELRQKVMELETQNNVTMNQIRRQADEMKKLNEQYDEVVERERQAHSLLNQEKSKYTDLDFQMKEQQMMKRIKELEQTQMVAELRQKISSLETKVCFTFQNQSVNKFLLSRLKNMLPNRSLVKVTWNHKTVVNFPTEWPSCKPRCFVWMSPIRNFKRCISKIWSNKMVITKAAIFSTTTIISRLHSTLP